MKPRARSWLFTLLLLALTGPHAMALDQAAPDGPWQEEALAGEDRLSRAHAAYLRDRQLQLTRPEQAEQIRPPPETPGWSRAFAGMLEWLAPVFRAIFYFAMLVVGLGISWFVITEALRLRARRGARRQTGPAEEVPADIRPDGAKARALLEEADALAAAGRYAEAVHLLLFRSIEDIQERLDGGIAPSLTAREIAGLSSLPARVAGALRPIIRIVENSHFGGRPVDAPAWQHARERYQAFAFGEAWT